MHRRPAPGAPELRHSIYSPRSSRRTATKVSVRDHSPPAVHLGLSPTHEARAEMITVTDSIEIARPPEQVFAYLTDPAKVSTWQNALEVRQLTPGPVGPGTRFREIHTALGIRARPQVTEVVAFEPGRRFDLRVVEGPPIDGRWDLEAIDGGTRLTLTPTARLPRPLRFAKPLAELVAAVLTARFHRRLKRALERQ